WDLIDPFTLVERATATDGRMLAGSGRYKALIVSLGSRGPATRNAISAQAIEHILALARQGLPVVFLGDAPGRGTGFAAPAAEAARVAAAVAPAESLANVRRAPAEADLPAALQALGVRPDFHPAAPVNLLPV